LEKCCKIYHTNKYSVSKIVYDINTDEVSPPPEPVGNVIFCILFVFDKVRFNP